MMTPIPDQVERALQLALDHHENHRRGIWNHYCNETDTALRAALALMKDA